MIGRPWLALAVTCAIALVAGCEAARPAGASPSAPSTSSSIVEPSLIALAPAGTTLGGQRAGDVLMWLASTPTQPTAGEASFDAYLVGLDGRPLDDAKVTLDTDMTNMSHGKYLVPAEPSGDGHYVGRVHFSMPGPWRILALVERPGEAPVKLRFEFTVASS
jgi:hypothetical protein